MTFKIKIRGTNQEFTCNPGETVVDAAQNANIDIPFSCHSGICQTCKGHVYSGDYTYGDIEPMVELDESQAEILLCCAQPKSDMVVDHPDLLAPEAPRTQHANLNINEKKN
ncbi:MAG: 2-polyprenylphenol hydroxylase / CDP-6-deoxy-delta-3,4-glucoseen reductase [Gammaproteobacteria bacterium]|jgi:CDP-4-dehydro-6-deoxyglucose reductase|nr:2-polyprenylphenol hydroxylase / CDP-6-deoxy-delta-3,4-glucoseen reductase [Gammaproteobacteria bacterium]